MEKRIHFAIGVLTIFLFALLFGTNPNDLPVPMLIAPFALLFLVVALCAFVALGRMTACLSQRQKVRMSGVCAGLPIMLLILQSVGQLNIRDAVGLALFFGLSFFYALRSSRVLMGR